MKKHLFELWAILLTGILSLGVVFAYYFDHKALAAGASGALLGFFIFFLIPLISRRRRH